ncbi:hypothetical protein WJX74_000161 [Apatococcus lobatus]|uniref:FAD dependent oxidoreductase domain-containing protein n=1 Tax=Apatococcus lobatus TaxID=904363 RepID=A0AAW1QTC0_9CHLO
MQTIAAGQAHQSSPLRVAVVGAGLLGSSAAWQLAKRGCEVVVIEAAKRPAEGASGKSWAWLNANRKTPSHYKELNSRSMQLWHQFPDLAEFPGTISVGDARDEDPAYKSSNLSSADVSSLEPELSADARAQPMRLYSQEGFAYPAEANAHFLHQAERQGASVRLSEVAMDFHKAAGTSDAISAVMTDKGTYETDLVVLACGERTPEMAAKLGVPFRLADKPSDHVVHTKPMPRTLHHIVIGGVEPGEELFIVQRRNGAFLIAYYKGEGAHPKVVNEETGRQVLHRAARLVPALAHAEVDHIVVGDAPTPFDGLPVTGFHPACSNAYILCSHSGATLAPLLGQLVAQEIADKQPADLLQHYRPTRNFNVGSHVL